MSTIMDLVANHSYSLELLFILDILSFPSSIDETLQCSTSSKQKIIVFVLFFGKSLVVSVSYRDIRKYIFMLLIEWQPLEFVMTCPMGRK